MAQQNAEATQFDPRNPNASLNLKGFDYKDLTGEPFKKYEALLEELSPVLGHAEHTDSLFDFELHRVEPVFKEVYPGLPKTPIYLDGVKLKSVSGNASLVHKTRITIKAAREMNNQIHNRDHSMTHGKYYFLKQIK